MEGFKLRPRWMKVMETPQRKPRLHPVPHKKNRRASLYLPHARSMMKRTTMTVGWTWTQQSRTETDAARSTESTPCRLIDRSRLHSLNSSVTLQPPSPTSFGESVATSTHTVEIALVQSWACSAHFPQRSDSRQHRSATYHHRQSRVPGFGSIDAKGRSPRSVVTSKSRKPCESLSFRKRSMR